MQTINLIVFPQPPVNIIFLFKIRQKVYQDSNWATWNIPSPHPDIEFFSLSYLYPICKQGLVLNEIGTFVISPHIWTNKYNMVFHF